MSTITEKVLFIGGCADGQRLKKPDSEYYKVARAKPLPRFVSDHIETEPIFECDLYQKQKVRSGEKVYEFYALESMSAADCIACLIDGYEKA